MHENTPVLELKRTVSASCADGGLIIHPGSSRLQGPGSGVKGRGSGGHRGPDGSIHMFEDAAVFVEGLHPGGDTPGPVQFIYTVHFTRTGAAE